MTAVGITENVKGDTKKFEIWYNAREEVYIIQVRPSSCPANQGAKVTLRPPQGGQQETCSENQVNSLHEVHPPEAVLGHKMC